MATVQTFKTELINSDNSHLSPLKALVETQFYRNNVLKVENLQHAYELASQNPNTIVLDRDIKHYKELGLKKGTKMLVENNGSRYGRNAKARRIVGKQDDAALRLVIMDALSKNPHRTFYHAQAVVGLDEEFMINAHLCINETQENNLYSWLLNFQILNDEYAKRLKKSKLIDENDIYVYCDSTWTHPDYPDGLAYFDPLHNVACILGMTYFGELKKGTLTLAWASAYRAGYVACHGGLKSFKKKKSNYVASFFGLSGSGKSTLTHAQHDQKFKIEVLHDDAFIIDLEEGFSIALEPSYFDKTQDYPPSHREQDYFLTLQNVGVTLNEKNEKVSVTQDLRNGNGRTVKSRYSTPNRVDRINEPINALYWIMKDDSLPPLLKITDPVLASTFGLTLATKRTSAEIGVVDRNALVIEPYANPFRVYDLNDDYIRFKELFNKGVDCFILNTGSYLGQDIPKEVTLGLIENEVNQTNEFKPFFNHPSIQLAEVDGVELHNTQEALDLLLGRIETRINYVKKHNETYQKDQLESEALEALESMSEKLHL